LIGALALPIVIFCADSALTPGSGEGIGAVAFAPAKQSRVATK